MHTKQNKTILNAHNIVKQKETIIREKTVMYFILTINKFCCYLPDFQLRRWCAELRPANRSEVNPRRSSARTSE